MHFGAAASKPPRFTARTDLFDDRGELVKWLDPISGLEQRADILRAAVSIFVERDYPKEAPSSRRTCLLHGYKLRICPMAMVVN